MKRMPILWMTLLMLAGLTGCIKDTLIRTYTYRKYTPVYATTQQVRENIGNLPAEPVEAPGKMYLYGNYIFLNERGKGIHIINNANPAAPVNESFVAIPGCEDVAVLGNALYADCYTDLVVLDIGNPKGIMLSKWIPNLFPDRRWVMDHYLDSNTVIVDWIVKDTTVSDRGMQGNVFWWGGFLFARADAAAGSVSSGSPTPGKGGSMARFAITKQHLYTVTNNTLHVMQVQKPLDPNWVRTVQLEWGIETIYPFKDNLFIGGNTGMYIYTIQDPADPKRAGTFAHARVCDPVIADDKYAYVTLRNGSLECQGFTNQLDVVDISSVFFPKLVKSYNLTNPHGLDKDGNWLYVCDGRAGLRVMDATNVQQIQLRQTIPVANAYDVICHNKVAIVSAGDGLYQYDISNPNAIRQLSRISIAKN